MKEYDAMACGGVPGSRELINVDWDLTMEMFVVITAFFRSVLCNSTGLCVAGTIEN